MQRSELSVEELVRRALVSWSVMFFGGILDAIGLGGAPCASARARGEYLRPHVGGAGMVRLAPCVVREGLESALVCALHQLVHGFVWLEHRTDESSYDGHGPLFADACNLIGDRYGWRRVSPKGRGGLLPAGRWPSEMAGEGGPGESVRRESVQASGPFVDAQLSAAVGAMLKARAAVLARTQEAETAALALGSHGGNAQKARARALALREAMKLMESHLGAFDAS